MRIHENREYTIVRSTRRAGDYQCAKLMHVGIEIQSIECRFLQTAVIVRENGNLHRSRG